MIWFIVTVVVVYLYYYLWVIRKYDEKGNRVIKEKKNKKKGKSKEKGIEQPKKKKEIDKKRSFHHAFHQKRLHQDHGRPGYRKRRCSH